MIMMSDNELLIKAAQGTCTGMNTGLLTNGNGNGNANANANGNGNGGIHSDGEALLKINSLSNPLQQFCRDAIATGTGTGTLGTTNGDSDGSDMDDAIERVDQFEIAARSHLLSLIDQLLQSQSQSQASQSKGQGQSQSQSPVVQQSIQEILKYIRGVIDFVLLVCSTNSKQYSHINTVQMRKLPFLLLEDAVDTLPTSILQTFWKYGPATWLQSILCNKKQHDHPSASASPSVTVADTIFHQNQGSKYCLIRMCNKILKNLSGSTNAQDEAAQFAGEISMVLASVFPLSERSAVNVLGAFHTDEKYQVEYEALGEWLENSRGSSSGTSVGASGSGFGKGSNSTITSGTSNSNSNSNSNSTTAQAGKGGGAYALNYGFYSKFWSLQKQFTNPKQLLPRTNAQGTQNLNPQWNPHMDGFLMDLRDVLSTFEGCGCELEEDSDLVRDLNQRWRRIKGKSLEALPVSSLQIADVDVDVDVGVDVDVDVELKDQDHTHTGTGSTKRQYKYLTNSQLLRLQIQDPEIRIHFLTQLSILSTYLSTSLAAFLNTTVGGGIGIGIGSENNTKMACEKVQKSLLQLEKRAGELMKRTPPNGEAHWDSLQWILKEREAVWREWKRDKCSPPIEKFASGGGGVVGASAAASALTNDKALNASIREKANTYLYSIDLLQDLPTISKKMSQHDKMTQFLDEYADALDPEAGIEEEYHPKNNKLSSWRALRSLSKQYIGDLGDDVDGNGDGGCMIRKQTGDFEGIVRKIWKEVKGIDIPGDMPMSEAISDDEVNTNEEEDEVMDEQEVANGSESTSTEKEDSSNDATKKDQGTAAVEEKEVENKADNAAVNEKGTSEAKDDDETGEIDESTHNSPNPEVTPIEKMEVDKSEVKKETVKPESKEDANANANNAKINEEKETAESEAKEKIIERRAARKSAKVESKTAQTTEEKASQESKPVKRETTRNGHEKSQDSSKVSKEAKKAPNGEHEKEAENTSNRKRKHDDVADEKPTDSSKILKVDEKNDKAINADKSKGGRNNGLSTKTQQNDDARGRAPPHRNSNRSQRARQTPEPRQQSHPPPQRRGSDRGEKRSQSPPPRPRREVNETHGGGQGGTHTRFFSPDGRDNRGGRRGQPDSRRQTGGGSGSGGGGPRQYDDRRNNDAGGRGGRGRDDRRGMQDGGGRGGGEHPDRRGHNDGGRNGANHRARGRKRN